MSRVRNQAGPGPLPACVVIAGPTAAGKTEIAMALARHRPVRLISADSVQVYRGMDIGSAKPSPETLREFPHALIDIRDPEEGFSAAEFVREAESEIARAAAAGRTPVIVGGTPLYLRALRWGLDPMPPASPGVRAAIEREAAEHGWAEMHRRLAAIDPASGRRIRPSDPQRIQRALEICRVTGRPASAFLSGRGQDRMGSSLMLVIAPGDRRQLHKRIERRWSRMLQDGLIEEVRRLLERPGLHPGAPALRSIGYRQAVECLQGRFAHYVLPGRGAAATRRLAKRQLTAFRQWPGAFWYDPLNRRTIDRIINRVDAMRASRGGVVPDPAQRENCR